MLIRSRCNFHWDFLQCGRWCCDQERWSCRFWRQGYIEDRQAYSTPKDMRRDRASLMILKVWTILSHDLYITQPAWISQAKINTTSNWQTQLFKIWIHTKSGCSRRSFHQSNTSRSLDYDEIGVFPFSESFFEKHFKLDELGGWCGEGYIEDRHRLDIYYSLKFLIMIGKYLTPIWFVCISEGDIKKTIKIQCSVN